MKEIAGSEPISTSSAHCEGISMSSPGKRNPSLSAASCTAAFCLSVIAAGACQPDLDSLSAKADEQLSGGSGGTSGGSGGSSGTSGTSGSGPQSCEDDIKNAGETDVDCGGSSLCQRCRVDQVCTTNFDCDSNYCRSNRCSVATCSDGVKNQDETGIDCGGICAPDQRCAVGGGCALARDCSSEYCHEGLCVSHCLSGVVDGDETDTDCGGEACNACATGLDCQENADCSTNLCREGTCEDPSCSDNVKNQDETDVDCGGSCAVTRRCPTAANCSVANDCESFICQSNECVADIPPAIADVIDFLEDGDNRIEPVAGRTGYWYKFNDTAGTQLHGNEEIPGARGTSLWAYHTSGSGFTSWGSGIGLDLNGPGGQSKQPYNASAYLGVTFWGRAESTLPLKVVFPDAHTDPAGGICTVCDKHFIAAIQLDAQWRKFTILFSSLTQEGVSTPPRTALDSAQLMSIQWRTNPGAVYDYWIDDIAFKR
jgi:hypothetical protein